jgi:hypothetical protein
MKFQATLKAVLDCLWETVMIVWKHPVFWVIVAGAIIWVFSTHSPGPGPDVCPCCHQVIAR